MALLLSLLSMEKAMAPVAIVGERTPTPAMPESVQRPVTREGWDGTPAPTPGNYVRPTRAYRVWREACVAACEQLAREGRTAEADGLRQWQAAFEQSGILRAQQQDATGKPVMTSPLFKRRAIQAVIGPPPIPAFERFYGYKIVLPWNGAVYYYAANAIPQDSPYLLHANGVRDAGTPVVKRPDIHMLFACAGITDTMAKYVLMKVSRHEGGFDAVNTWDTGYVSVGFIQFITGETGAGHSLVQVLGRMKADEARLAARPQHVNEFDRYFAEHGIDVRNGQLFVCDPYSGNTHSGAEAVTLIINDKRLTAMFQDAGAKSRAFQLAQIREAYGSYYLANGPFRLPGVEVSVYRIEEAAVAPPEPPPLEEEAAEPMAMAEDTAETPIAPVATMPLPPAAPALQAHLVRRRCVYGEAAVQRALAGTITPAAFARQQDGAAPGTVFRVAHRLPPLMGTYGEVLASEGGQVTLTDRAVQCGVRNAVETFVAAVNALEADHPLTIAELRDLQPALIATLKNRIDVLAPTTAAHGANVKR